MRAQGEGRPGGGSLFGVGEFSDHFGVAPLREASASEAAAAKIREECQEIRSAEQMGAVLGRHFFACAIGPGAEGAASGDASRCRPPVVIARPT
ncbi:hypothetical protein SSPO_087220 [Streptomyces antimycoticus]|uniref:Uncharacterized protein n=1 Tax=Streptomyces antimycoticus TaxID=68175 RepID=A0A499UVL6_9ACTN|nr:hypothetical protein SSPO_087220 [Streptomyces antimycoticus]